MLAGISTNVINSSGVA